MDYDEAYRKLSSLGFEVTSYPDIVIGAGVDTVTAQSPKPGTVVKRGRSVSIGVNAPPENMSIPSLVGATETEAVQRLAELNLQLSEVTYAYSSVPKGAIISQSPEAGATLSDTEGVSVVISRGAEVREVAIPNVQGLDIDRAVAKLKELGFNRVETMPSSLSFSRPGIVTEQFPAAQQVVPVSAPVTLYYSLSSRNIVKVPEVKGMMLERAQTVLEAAGLRATWLTEVEDTSKANRTVVGITPQGYTLPGTAVKLTVVNNREGTTVYLPPSNLDDDSLVDFDFDFGLPDDATDDNNFTPGVDTRDFGIGLDNAAEQAGTTEQGSRNGESGEALGDGSRRIPIRFDPVAYGLPQGEAHDFRLMVIDDRGERVAIEQTIPPGGMVDSSVNVYGEAQLQIYLGDILYTAWNP